jgi:hypothetical protein
MSIIIRKTVNSSPCTGNAKLYFQNSKTAGVDPIQNKLMCRHEEHINMKKYECAPGDNSF